MRALLLITVTVLLPAALSGAPAPPRPQAQAGDFTLRIAQLSRTRTATLAFDPQAADSPGPSAVSALGMQLEVSGRTPAMNLRVAGLTPDLLAIDESGEPLDFTQAALAGAGPAAALLNISAASRAVNSRELRLFTGELIIYPHAERVHVEVP